MAFAGIEVKLSGYLALAQLAIDERGAIGRVLVVASVLQADGAGLGVELEDRGEADVRAVALARGRRALLAVGGDVGRGIEQRPVDVAGHGVELVDGRVGRRLRTGGEEQSQVRAGRHAYHAYLLGIETTLASLAAHHAHSALAVLPRRLIYGQSRRPRRAIYEVDALEAQLREAFAPPFDEAHVAAVVVGATGDENHAAAVPHICRRRIEPLEIGHAVLVGLELRRTGLIGHGGNLMSLSVGHLALRPNRLALKGEDIKREADADQHCEQSRKATRSGGVGEWFRSHCCICYVLLLSLFQTHKVLR